MPRRSISTIALAGVLIAGCDSGTVSPTTAPPGVSTTTTTIENDSCRRLAADTAAYLATLIEVLDQLTLEETRDRDAWPEALFAMEIQGQALDARLEEMRCDPAEVQTAVFAFAELDPDSELAAYLLELLGQ